MVLARRTLLLGGALGLVGCTGSPTIDVDPSATPHVQVDEEPQQHPTLASAAALVGGLRAQLEAAAPGAWRDAALAQCDAQLARFNSPAPLGEPEPIFSPEAGRFSDLPTAVTDTVSGLVACADEAPHVAERVLFLSAAAATSGLADTESMPGEGAEPTFFETLESQWPVALGHTWALVYGLETALGRARPDDGLRDSLRARLTSAKSLRNHLREHIDGVAPSQPASFALPTAMSTPEEVASGWAELEVRLLEGLVLLAADDGGASDLWRPQVVQAQAAGGRIPRWPGWD
ncbi:MAG: hypothetical protein GX596_04450 [Propionibacterium sp.]|nr:hypothetical protein [Propionibacterium sp.]